VGGRAAVLIVDDEIVMARPLSRLLKEAGYDADYCLTWQEAKQRLRQRRYDVIVMDWQLHGITGLEATRELRASGDTTPVLILTGRHSREDIGAVFEAGADDFATKPIDGEFHARLRRLAHSSAPAVAEGRWTFGPLVIDAAERLVTVHGQQVVLGALEMTLAIHLARCSPRAAPRSALLDAIWGRSSDVQLQAVDKMVQRVRGKVGDDAKELIVTLRGVGYALVEPGTPPPGGRERT
jgi:DNA-binding response OmpR family regulator